MTEDMDSFGTTCNVSLDRKNKFKKKVSTVYNDNI